MFISERQIVDQTACLPPLSAETQVRSQVLNVRFVDEEVTAKKIFLCVRLFYHFQYHCTNIPYSSSS